MPHELLRSTELLKQILEILPIGVWIIDRDGGIAYGNPASIEIWKGARYVGMEEYGEYKGWWRTTGKRIEANEWAAARAIQYGETSLDEEIEIECFDGSRKVILHSGVPLRDDHGDIIGCVIVNVDITDRVALEDRLRSAVDTDALTGVDSRRRFYETMTVELARANRYERSLSLCMFDVDRFKDINDRHGHQIGDQVLERIAALFRRQLRGGAHLARFGGDEFMVLLPEARLADAMQMIERLHQSLAGYRFDVVGTVTCSFGVCEYHANETVDSFIRRADRALYEAKTSGRDRVSTGPHEEP